MCPPFALTVQDLSVEQEVERALISIGNGDVPRRVVPVGMHIVASGDLVGGLEGACVKGSCWSCIKNVL